LLPLGDGRSSLVWSVDSARADALMALTPDAFDNELTDASGAVLGRCTVSTPRAQFPLQLKVASQYVRPRFALLGDAAHSVHPLAGQGLNLGLLDCAALADLLSGLTPAQFGDLRALRRYERERKSENLLAATAFDGLNRLFSNSHPLLSGLRSAGLGSVGRVPALRRFFARNALGI
jgi:2-octaprenylphenol hydroxylase